MDRVWRGAALRRARMLAGKSIKQVAGVLGVTEGAISQQELGLTNTDLDQLRALADFYGMPLETLLYEIGEPIHTVSLGLREWYEQQSPGRSVKPRRFKVSDASPESPRERGHNPPEPPSPGRLIGPQRPRTAALAYGR